MLAWLLLLELEAGNMGMGMVDCRLLSGVFTALMG
jgi:hypothetical protein